MGKMTWNPNDPCFDGKKPFCWKVLERPKNRGHLQVTGTYLWIHSLKINEINISHLGKRKIIDSNMPKIRGYVNSLEGKPPKRRMWDSPLGISQGQAKRHDGLRAARFTRSKAARKASRKSCRVRLSGSLFQWSYIWGP